jgi:chromosome segregation ATPase
MDVDNNNELAEAQALFNAGNGDQLSQAQALLLMTAQRQQIARQTDNNQFAYLHAQGSVQSSRSRKRKLEARLTSLRGNNETITSAQAKRKERLQKLASEITTNNDIFIENKQEIRNINKQLANLPKENDDDDDELL